MSDINEKINNIEEELAQILEARYGKDVRQSIHDSIAKCYDEATGKIQQELIDSITENANKATTAADKSESEAARASSQAAAAEEYAIGDTDSAKYYFNQVKDISQSLSGTLKPRGTVAYAELPAIESADAGDMYNIEDEFVTTDLFKEGEGKTVPAGSNVYKTADSMWDVLAGSPVTGVKGAKESTYKQGNVNITAEHIGALATDGDAGDTTVAYTSNDSTAAPDATPPALLTTGEKLSSLFGKISTLAKNIRWLLGKMGSTDISAIGDGTITGALSTLNSKIMNVQSGRVQTAGTGKWASFSITFKQPYTSTPLITITNMTPFSSENTMVTNVTLTGFVLGIYAPTTSFDYQVRWQAVGY